MEATPRPDGAPEASAGQERQQRIAERRIAVDFARRRVARCRRRSADTGRSNRLKRKPPIVDPAAVAPTQALVPTRHLRRALCCSRVIKRYALLAASVTFAAALGAIIGALASGGSSAHARKPDVAAIEQNKAMQQSIARLGKEITTLRASLEQANKSAHSPDRQDYRPAATQRLSEVTGSISPPQTTPAPALTPMPTPRPRAARRRGGSPAARPSAGGAGLDDPRRARRLCLCGKPRRDLSGRCSAHRCPASARCSRSSGRTAAGWW